MILANERREKLLKMQSNIVGTLSYPEQINFELTTRCPLNCPQCYCDLNTGLDLDYDRALYVLRNGADNGLCEVNLSGGETMLYPRLFDLIAVCSELGVESNVALSGWGVDKTSLAALVDSGVSRIFVSLNGSTDAVNRFSRNGYDLAMNTLELLREAKVSETFVNFVAHSNNCEDFLNVANLCDNYAVGNLIVIAAKPTSSGGMDTLPNREQSLKLANDIRYTRDNYKVNVSVEPCYSQLRAYLGRSYIWGNTNTGIQKGCAAGRTAMSLDVTGNFTPCRHIVTSEYFDTAGDYWARSLVLSDMRGSTCKGDECQLCKLDKFCAPCLTATRNSVDACCFMTQESEK